MWLLVLNMIDKRSQGAASFGDRDFAFYTHRSLCICDDSDGTFFMFLDFKKKKLALADPEEIEDRQTHKQTDTLPITLYY